MSNIHVITDTDSSLPASVANQYGIVQVPITIQFGDETFETGVNIDDKLLFQKIDALKKLPSTAAPSPAAFGKAFSNAFDAGAESIICVVVGSKVSRTYDSAINAVEDFPGKKITVIDSEFMSLGQGFVAIAAAEALAKGATHEEAVNAAVSVLPRLQLYGSLTTLKYLAMGGRVGNLAAGMADLLNIRPILTMLEGKLGLLEKVRTRKAAMERLIVLLEESANGKEIEKAGIVHINNLTDAAELESRLRKDLKMPDEILVAELTPGLSVHAGSGMVAAVLLTKE